MEKNLVRYNYHYHERIRNGDKIMLKKKHLNGKEKIDVNDDLDNTLQKDTAIHFIRKN